MILILADDLSGAAELAGLAAAMGHKAEVQTEVDTRSKATVVAIDTQSRSLTPERAAERVAMTFKRTQILNPQWIYKKTDSALRGNIAAELESLWSVTSKSRILFIPANPSKGRTSVGGEYLIQGRPISETLFSQDPEHPIRHARIVDAIEARSGLDRLKPYPIGPNQQSPQEGLVIPDISCTSDLARRVSEVNCHTLPAGAADFFAALLKHNIKSSTEPTPPLPIPDSGRSLFVCGSLAAWDAGLPKRAEAIGIPVFTLQDLITNPARVTDSLLKKDRAVLAIGSDFSPTAAFADHANPRRLLQELVSATMPILEKRCPNQLFLEGGATASGLLAGMNWKSFNVLPTPLPGIGCLKPKRIAHAPTLYVKPGSYPWPESVWQSLASDPIPPLN